MTKRRVYLLNLTKMTYTLIMIYYNYNDVYESDVVRPLYI